MILRTKVALAFLLSVLINQTGPAFCEVGAGITQQPQNMNEYIWSAPDNENAEIALQAALVATKNDPKKQLLILQTLADFYHENKKTVEEKDTLVAWINLAKTINDYPLVYLATQNLRLSFTYFALGECDNAEKAAKTALEMYRISSGGEISPSVALALNNLAWIESKQKNSAAAEFHLTYALSIIKKVAGKDSLFYGLIAENLAAFYDRRAEYEKALPLYKASLKALRQQLSADDPATEEVLRRYNETLKIVKQQEENNILAARNKRRLAGQKHTHE